MLQDIHPHRYKVEFRRKDPEGQDRVIVIRGDKVLLAAGQLQDTIPTHGALLAAFPQIDRRLVYLFSVDDTAFYLFPDALAEAAGFCYQDMQLFRNHQPSWLAFAGITACHLGLWYATHRYCGACREPMTHKADERALACGSCGLTIYPTIAPAVIVGVVDGDRILMTRYSDRPHRKLALVAGFMEIGETFEDTARREVLEEVGVRVKNLRYYKSQPWAFSGSVLTGFFAELDGSPEITIDPKELQEAVWVRRDDIPPDDANISLTSEMMGVFRDHGFSL